MAYQSVFRAQLFDGQTVIVTGGGSGIGRCTAHELASLGAHVVITGRKAEKLDTTAAEIREDGGSVSSLIFDIRDEDAVKQAVKSVLAERGRIDGHVNNDGGQYTMPRADNSKTSWDAVVDSNSIGGVFMGRRTQTKGIQKN